MSNLPSIGYVSLGCDKNRVDSEVMIARLLSNGFAIESNPANADIIIVNTCAFLEASRKESIDTILEMSQYKQDKCSKLIVTGCLCQKHGEELLRYLPEADCLVGVNYNDIVDIVKQCYYDNVRQLYIRPNDAMTSCPRVLTTLPHYAYIKIADGCNNYCSYCTIPYIRGRYRSMPTEEVVKQALMLTQQGVTEIILVAQDVTRYGLDLYGKVTLVPLLQELSKIPQIKWIRLLYCYPELIDTALLDEVANNDKVCKYLDIPLQHVDSDVLKAMNRRSSHDTVTDLFNRLNQYYPQIRIRSTFICGFPNESQAQYEMIGEFLRKYQLANVGFFAYSREKGTKSYVMSNQLPSRIKQQRVKQLYKLQQNISLHNNTSLLGKSLQCVVDEQTEITNIYCGRTQFQCPYIDGKITLISTRPLSIGQYVDVVITDCDSYDLVGEVL
ncbi:MAG: 30S ribosomal protein S12 methylthiotransferase RimO [Clostridia bacterium]|nr:30S ribosomal protein S12 methylthiotransferase RimO [Clostridia bacterium]